MGVEQRADDDVLRRHGMPDDLPELILGEGPWPNSAAIERIKARTTTLAAAAHTNGAPVVGKRRSVARYLEMGAAVAVLAALVIGIGYLRRGGGVDHARAGPPPAHPGVDHACAGPPPAHPGVAPACAGPPPVNGTTPDKLPQVTPSAVLGAEVGVSGSLIQTHENTLPMAKKLVTVYNVTAAGLTAEQTVPQPRNRVSLLLDDGSTIRFGFSETGGNEVVVWTTKGATVVRTGDLYDSVSQFFRLALLPRDSKGLLTRESALRAITASRPDEQWDIAFDVAFEPPSDDSPSPLPVWFAKSVLPGPKRAVFISALTGELIKTVPSP